MTEPTNDHQPDRIAEVLRLIEKIVRKSIDGNYLFRGEPEHYDDHKFKGRVSSNLYRSYIMPVRDKATGSFDETKHTYPSRENLKKYQASTIQSCKDHVAGIGNDEFEILTTLQHYGIQTNLIDFTTDCHIALFFACNGSHKKDGRVVLLNRSSDLGQFIKTPKYPQSRVLAQKSVFVEPPDGFIDPDILDTVNVPSTLKQWVLIYLRKALNIWPRTIFNDMQGFVEYTKQNKNEMLRHYMIVFIAEKGLDIERSRDNLNSAIDAYNKYIEYNHYNPNTYQKIAACYYEIGEYDQAIECYTKSIMFNPYSYLLYAYRGHSYMSNGMRNLAIDDFITAKTFIADQNAVANYVHTIKQQYDIDLPENASES